MIRNLGLRQIVLTELPVIANKASQTAAVGYAISVSHRTSGDITSNNNRTALA